jgi:hypothetical protein
MFTQPQSKFSSPVSLMNTSPSLGMIGKAVLDQKADNRVSKIFIFIA